ncbi:MAG: hypothetical protein ACXU99_06010 [Thermodesulfobacteriota bacterium]
MKIGFRRNDKCYTKMLMLAMSLIIPLVGCATTPMETHKKGMESLTEKEYFIPKKPIDRHFIGCAWSKQFGPVEDPACSDIRIKLEKSFDTMQQHFAYRVGLSLGGQSTGKATAELGVEAGKGKYSSLEAVQIISPISLADIPFEPNLPYITEALRLGNFKLKSETAGQAGVSVAASSVKGGIKGTMESDAGTSGGGLVVAYKLHVIDPKTYTKEDSGRITLEFDKTIDFRKANLFVRSYLKVIEPGSNQPLPRNLLWACDQADAKSKDMVAAWIIELRSKDPKRKSLEIAFPAFPKIEDCQDFSGVIYSRIDPLTDKIIRQKIDISIIQEEISDSLKPLKWEAQVSLVDESFNIKLVKQGDLEK